MSHDGPPNKMASPDDWFSRDIDRHQMQVIRDEGVNRHLRFKRPGTMCMHFDILTWPGYLCYTGDMGSYLFRRLDDMFEFFRGGSGSKPYRIDLRYWAEKLEAADKSDGISAFSADSFKAEVRDYFEQATDDDDDWPAQRKAALWDEIESQVLGRDWEGSADLAFQRLHDFEHDGFRFTDWDRECKEYSHRFRWCCHALVWAIATYDASRHVELCGAESEGSARREAPR